MFTGQQVAWQPKIDRNKEPTEPGEYWGREITQNVWGQVLLCMPCRYTVVAGIPNPLGLKLVAETRMQKPRYRSLNYYAWGPLTECERELLCQLSNQAPTHWEE